MLVKAPKPVKDSEDDNEYEVESIQGNTITIFYLNFED